MIIDYLDIYDELSQNIADLSDRERKMLYVLKRWWSNDPKLFTIPCEGCGVTLTAIDRDDIEPIIRCPLCRRKFKYDRRKLFG